ncbi:hypothetical protein HKX48_003256 [Thoreauomyces humboldtii]|nr:hypothetical protein HKX48_003256 [Thoreauomyces humboldtii]
MPCPIIVETVNKFTDGLISKGLENASDSDLQACGHVRLQTVDNKGAPRRNEYLYDLKANSTLGNTYVNNTIRLRDYKTKDTYGEHVIQVGPKTKQILDEICKRAKSDGEIVLFPPFEPGFDKTKTYKAHFNRVIAKPMWSSLLRYIFVSHRQEAGDAIFMAEREELARLMGHSVLQQQTTYTKRDLFAKWYADNDSADQTLIIDSEEEDNESTASTEKKRRRPTPYDPQELRDLEQLLNKHNGDLKLVVEEAKQRKLLLERRTVEVLRDKCQREHANRISNPGIFGRFPIKPSTKKQKKMEDATED